MTDVEYRGARAPRYDLLSDSFYRDPNPTLHQMRREDPVHWHPELDAWILTRYQDVFQVVRSPDFSVQRGGSISYSHSAAVRQQLDACSEFVFRWMVFSDPPQHTRLREVAAGLFSAHSLERMRRQITELSHELIDRLDRRVDLLADLAAPLPTLVTCLLLGLPRDDADLLKRWTAAMFRLFGAGIASEEVVAEAYRSVQESSAYFTEVIAARRARPGSDVLSAIISAEKESPRLSEEELLGLAVTLVAGAFETTTHLIGNGVLALLRHPDQLALLRERPELIENTVEELMRYDGPALSVVRCATRDVEVGGVPVSAGQRLYCMLHAANRDPEKFPDPDRLDVTRPNPRHLGFGFGIHFCLGAALTRIETAAVLAALIERFPELRLDHEALGGGEPVWIRNLAIRGVEALPVVLS